MQWKASMPLPFHRTTELNFEAFINFQPFVVHFASNLEFKRILSVLFSVHSFCLVGLFGPFLFDNLLHLSHILSLYMRCRVLLFSPSRTRRMSKKTHTINTNMNANTNQINKCLIVRCRCVCLCH